MIWKVTADKALEENLALSRITLICHNLGQTKAFYENSLGFPSANLSDGQVIYPNVDNTELSLWDANSAAAELNLPEITKQFAVWSAHTAMLAYGFDSLEKLEELYEDLTQMGVDFDHRPAYFDWDFNASYFRDPENNIWELFEHPDNIAERMLPDP